MSTGPARRRRRRSARSRSRTAPSLPRSQGIGTGAGTTPGRARPAPGSRLSTRPPTPPGQPRWSQRSVIDQAAIGALDYLDGVTQGVRQDDPGLRSVRGEDQVLHLAVDATEAAAGDQLGKSLLVWMLVQNSLGDLDHLGELNAAQPVADIDLLRVMSPQAPSTAGIPSGRMPPPVRIPYRRPKAPRRLRLAGHRRWCAEPARSWLWDRRLIAAPAMPAITDLDDGQQMT
jgi:hypothetical protein